MLDRAYALLTVKALDADRRQISGIASTPTADRDGDIIEPSGATFASQIPLLLFHNQQQPVGTVRLKHVAGGIAFDATLPAIAEPGRVRDRVDEAWHSIKAGLLLWVSIGFRPLAQGVKQLASGGSHFLRTEICELSLVTVPSNFDATITTVKQFDRLAASGASLPGVSGLPTRTTMQPTASEHVQNLANKRAADAARIVDILQAAAGEGATLTAEQATEHDALTLRVKALDADLQRWREVEKLQLQQAAPIAQPVAVPGIPRVSVKPNVPPGTAFVRMACAKLVCKGNLHEAAEYARRWEDSTPEVALHLKAAIAPATTTDQPWAGALVNQTVADEFLALLRPATILGKVENLRTVPFNTKVPAQTAGGTYGWVGEAKPKPVTKLAFAADSLGINKAAGIIVLTEELVRLSNPSAEALVRADMIAGIAAFLDQQFIDPAVALVAGINPASITNGAPNVVATTNPLADLMVLINYFAVNNVPVTGLTVILSPSNALALSFRTNPDGSAMFPGITMAGGNFKGINFITSNVAGANVIAFQPNLILYADDGGVTIDASREASLQMDSAPMSPPDATTVYVNLWQQNLVGLRAERFVSWKRASPYAVTYLTGAAYPAPALAEPTAA